jgi:hypothetical protein
MKKKSSTQKYLILEAEIVRYRAELEILARKILRYPKDDHQVDDLLETVVKRIKSRTGDKYSITRDQNNNEVAWINNQYFTGPLILYIRTMVTHPIMEAEFNKHLADLKKLVRITLGYPKNNDLVYDLIHLTFERLCIRYQDEYSIKLDQNNNEIAWIENPKFSGPAFNHIREITIYRCREYFNAENDKNANPNNDRPKVFNTDNIDQYPDHKIDQNPDHKTDTKNSKRKLLTKRIKQITKDKLSPEEREIIALKNENNSFAQIDQMMGKENGFAQRTYESALEKVKNALGVDL